MNLRTRDSGTAITAGNIRPGIDVTLEQHLDLGVDVLGVGATELFEAYEGHPPDPAGGLSVVGGEIGVANLVGGRGLLVAVAGQPERLAVPKEGRDRPAVFGKVVVR